MATAVNVNKVPLLDLSFLTAAEKAMVEAVVKADQSLLTKDRVRVGTLRQELEQQRYCQRQLMNTLNCTCCQRNLGRIFNSGAPCPSCMYRVCKECRIMCHKPPPPFLCPICTKKRLLDIQAAEYVSLPTSNFSPSPLFGSQLVMMSLEASKPKDRSSVHNPYNGKAKRTLLSHMSQTDIDPRSSLAMDSTKRFNDAGGVAKRKNVLSGKSDSVLGRLSENESLISGTSLQKERPNSLPARKISPSEYSDSEEESEKNVLEVPGLSKMRHSESISSIGSLTSMYSAAGGKGDYAISGEVKFGVWYSQEGLLLVHIDQARNLAAARKEGYSYPYVKIYLLPDKSKHTKRKTGFVRRTVSPKYDETFKYKVSESELSSRTLWLSVWDWDRFGRNQFLGEMRVPLSSLDLTNTTDQWYTLMDQEESAHLESDSQYRGRLKLSLMLELEHSTTALPPVPPSQTKPPHKKAILHVAIKEAEDLPKMDSMGSTNAVVKCYLLPGRNSSNKRKTQVVMNCVSPVWNEEFIYKCLQKELVGDRVLEITIWDYDKRGSNDFIGGLRIGPQSGTSRNRELMDSLPEEVSHWETIIAQPGEWVERWHTLRPRMDRSITALPEKPSSFSRELSPVHESLSPPAEEEEEDENIKKGSGAVPQNQPVSGLSAKKSLESPLATTPRAISVSSPSKEVGRSPTRRPSPLTQAKMKHENRSGKSDTSRGASLSHSPSPVPQLLVTADPAGIPHSTSTGSFNSIHSDNRGDYQITGEVQIQLLYHRGKLMIHVNRARGLAAANSNGYSDPYVKTYLLPDRSKHSKRKTSVKKKTLDPIFNETLEYSVSESELSSRTLWLSVWDWDRLGRNQFLGEMRVPLQSFDLQDEAEIWYPLVDKDQPYNLNPRSPQIQIALKFSPTESEGGVTRGTLLVEIKHARNLSIGTETRLTPHSFVSCSLLPDFSNQKKTAVIKNTSAPSWMESFTFERVTVEDIARERVLEVKVLDSNRGIGEDGLIGGMRIGPFSSGTARKQRWMDSTGEEVAHWEMVLAQPGEWVERWHTLRTTMEPYSRHGNTLSKDNEFHKTVPKRDKFPKTNVPINISLLDDVFRKTGPMRDDNHKTAQKRDKSTPESEEFRKTVAKSSNSSSRESLTKTMTSSSNKPVENRFESGSNPSLSRNISPLTLGEISRSKDPLHSRSMSPEIAISPDIAPWSTLERSTNQKPPSGPLKRAGLLGVKHGGSHSSFGSQMSIYSAAGGGKGDYDITGEVLVGISYHGGQLMVHVNRARGLAAANSNGYSDPYVKTYLLPDRSKHSKRKTSVNKRTLNPIYDQTLIYKVSESELSSRTLWLSVWDWDRFGRNQFLGEMRVPLSSLDLTNTTDQWYTLMDQDDSETTDFYRGQLHLALRYSPSGTKKGKTRGSLQIVIKQGRDFPSMGGNEKPDPVVKCYLLPDKSSSGKQKVGVIKNDSNPTWEEMVAYDKIVLEEIATERVLEVTVWDWDKKGSSFIGGLRIGPTPSGTTHHREWMDSIGEEASHWEMVLANPGEWVEQWHTLRTTMDPRSIAFQ